MFLCELALDLGMPVGELGQRMSAHELNVIWPAYKAVKRREHEREVARQQHQPIRTMGGGGEWPLPPQS